jgi:hypothetical protein
LRNKRFSDPEERGDWKAFGRTGSRPGTPSGGKDQRIGRLSGRQVHREGTPSGEPDRRIGALSGAMVRRIGKSPDELIRRIGRPSGRQVRREGTPSGEPDRRIGAPSGAMVRRIGKSSDELIRKIEKLSGGTILGGVRSVFRSTCRDPASTHLMPPFSLPVRYRQHPQMMQALQPAPVAFFGPGAARSIVKSHCKANKSNSLSGQTERGPATCRTPRLASDMHFPRLRT